MVTITCLVDNAVLHSSPLWGEHGVSFLIETPDGRVLFDVGQSGTVLLHNAAQMGIDLASVDALALSHAHHDHTGGLESLFASTQRRIPLYANPGLFRRRYSIKDDQARSIGLKVSQAVLERWFELRLKAEPMQILRGVWTTGEIDARPEFVGSSPNLFIEQDGAWQPDPYQDDMSLVIEAGEGLVLVCGCCHAGLLNTLAHVRRCFSRRVLAILGGTHLVSAKDEILSDAVSALEEYCGSPPRLYPNHCTGENALYALRQAYGEQVQPCPAGTVVSFT